MSKHLANSLPPPYASAHPDDLVGDTEATAKLQSRLFWGTVLPVGAMAVLGVAAVTALAVRPSPGTLIVVVAVGVPLCAATLITAMLNAKRNASAVVARLNAANQYVQQEISTLRSSIAAFKQKTEQFVQRARGGEPPTPHSPENRSATGPFGFLDHDLLQALHIVESAVAGDGMRGSASQQRVEVFLNLSLRLQSLAHRMIQKVDELESGVEDPDLLKSLFELDHLATGARRQAENLAVLGGAMPGRTWSKPVRMFSVLRSAVAEVEEYARVKVLPPIDGALQGHAVAEIVHLIAELVENATRFSRPETKVVLRAQKVTAGLAIEIEDRGLGVEPKHLKQINKVLSSTTRIELGELLEGGQIGLWVVSQLARRQGVKARLYSNIFGGIEAVVVIPHQLLGDEAEEIRPKQIARQSLQEPTPAIYTSAPSGIGRSFTAQGEIPLTPEETGGFPSVPAESSAQPARASAATGASSTASLERRMAGATLESAAGAGTVRPPLVRRNRDVSYLAPELLDPRVDNTSLAEHDPTLVSMFQQGFNRSIHEDHDPSDSDTHHS